MSLAAHLSLADPTAVARAPATADAPAHRTHAWQALIVGEVLILSVAELISTSVSSCQCHATVLIRHLRPPQREVQWQAPQVPHQQLGPRSQQRRSPGRC